MTHLIPETFSSKAAVYLLSCVVSKDVRNLILEKNFCSFHDALLLVSNFLENCEVKYTTSTGITARGNRKRSRDRDDTRKRHSSFKRRNY